MAVVETQSGWVDRREGAGVSWGAIFAGVVFSLGIWMLLYSFGLAVGLTAIDPNDASSLKGVGIGTGIWSLIAPLIALFLGGLVAARLAGFLDRGAAALHGGVVWALTSLAGFFVLASVIGSIVGGAATLGGKAVSGAAGAAGGGQQAMKSLGVDTSDLVGPLNERLRAQGKPEVTADQLQAATRDALGTAVREGRFDRQLFTQSLSEHTALSQQDANEIAGQIEQRYTTQLQGAQEGALGAAEKSGVAFWALFGALLLSLVSAMLGALTGYKRTHRVETHRHVEVRPPPTTPRGEVYP